MRRRSGVVGPSWRRPGGVVEVQRRHGGVLGTYWGRPWGLLGASWGNLGCAEGVSEAFWGLKAPFEVSKTCRTAEKRQKLWKTYSF